jgi:hypothetical protein
MRHAIRNNHKTLLELEAHIEEPDDARAKNDSAQEDQLPKPHAPDKKTIKADTRNEDMSEHGLTDEEAIYAASLEPGVPYVFVRHGDGWHRVTIH